jgi:hypothetical protein
MRERGICTIMIMEKGRLWYCFDKLLLKIKDLQCIVNFIVLQKEYIIPLLFWYI